MEEQGFNPLDRVKFVQMIMLLQKELMTMKVSIP